MSTIEELVEDMSYFGSGGIYKLAEMYVELEDKYEALLALCSVDDGGGES